MRDPRSQLLEQTSLQAVWCRNLGSPLYGVLLEGVAEDVQRDGPCWRVLESHADTTIATALPLRFMGAVHKLVLAGQAPALAAYYPSAGGHEPATAAWPAFRDTVEAHIDHLRQSTSDGVQTNEVGRTSSPV